MIPVYLVHWSAPDWIRSSVASISHSDVAIEITVVTNSGPVEVSGATVLDTGGNLGFAGGANVAIRNWLESPEPSPVAVVGTHDLHLDMGAVGRMAEAMLADPSLGLCGPAMPDTPRVPARGEGGQEWLSGQCIMLRRECAIDLGGYDERFGTYVEDRDLCLRAWDAGWQVRQIPGATGHGLGSVSKRARMLRLGNAVALARKRRGARAGLKLLMAQPLLALLNLKDAIVEPRRARYHLRYAGDRILSIPFAIRQFRRFGNPWS